MKRPLLVMMSIFFVTLGILVIRDHLFPRKPAVEKAQIISRFGWTYNQDLFAAATLKTSRGEEDVALPNGVVYRTKDIVSIKRDSNGCPLVMNEFDQKLRSEQAVILDTEDIRTNNGRTISCAFVLTSWGRKGVILHQPHKKDDVISVDVYLSAAIDKE